MRLGAQKFAAFFAHSCQPRGVCFLGCVECAEADFLSVSCHPSTESSSSAFHATRKRSGGKNSIPKIFLPICQPQISPAIISRITVLMVNFCWLVARLHFPDDPMGKISDVFYRDKNPSCRIYVPSALSGISSIPSRVCSPVIKMMQRPFLPYQNAGLRTVTETVTQIGSVRQWFRHPFISLKPGALA